jgi:hypothetical protein
MKYAWLLLLTAVTGRSTLVADGAKQPQVAVDADGGIYVAFIRGGNIEVSVSTDQGKTFSRPVVAIDAKGRANGGMQRGPRIGVDAKKNVYVTAPVCFDETEFKKKYPTSELWLAVSSDGGKTFGKPVRINEVEKKAAEALHWTAVSPAGDVYVAWIDGRDNQPSVYFKKISDLGKKPGKDVRVAAPVCECCAPGLTVDEKGNPIVTYREGGKKASREIFAARSDNKGGSFGQPVQVNRQGTKLPS